MRVERNFRAKVTGADLVELLRSKGYEVPAHARCVDVFGSRQRDHAASCACEGCLGVVAGEDKVVVYVVWQGEVEPGEMEASKRAVGCNCERNHTCHGFHQGGHAVGCPVWELEEAHGVCGTWCDAEGDDPCGECLSCQAARVKGAAVAGLVVMQGLPKVR